MHVQIHMRVYENSCPKYMIMWRCSVLQCVAVCCSVLQCVAVCCSVLQYVAAHVCMHVQIHMHMYVYSRPKDTNPSTLAESTLLFFFNKKTFAILQRRKHFWLCF